ncbi:MAG: hypothetical protein PHI37_02415 [Candidatus Gracilibacteria bacterium]|nr:hypothetical protein [Candidatus Gracilibacteria bacterium]
MKLGLLSAIAIATGLNLGCSDEIKIEDQKEVVSISVEKILKIRMQLLEMVQGGKCQLTKYEDRGDQIEGYRCNGGKDYVITILNDNNTYYGIKGEECKNAGILLENPADETTYEGKRAFIIQGEGEEEELKINNDKNCQDLYPVIQS